MLVFYQRCAAIDIGKDVIAVAVRLPGDGPDHRQTIKRTFKTFYGVLKRAARWLTEQLVTHVAMEATGIYSMPVYHALIEHGGFEQVLVCNAGHVRNVPGRKTDLSDAEWLVHLLECGLLRGSFIPPAQIKAARDVIRYRTKLTESRTSELQRLGNILQDAAIKVDSVASTITARSVRAMVEALIDGERRPLLALEGRFDDHHALMCRLHLDHLDHLDEMIVRLDTQIEDMMQPFRAQRDLLTTIPGIGPFVAAAIISEAGADIAETFPSADQFASWIGVCPGNHESAGKRHSGKPRKGNQHLQHVLVECAWAASRTPGYLQVTTAGMSASSATHATRPPKNKAIVAVAHKLAIIIWHVLATGKPYADLGADYFDRRIDPAAETRRLIARLQALGHTVTIEPAA